MTRVLEADLVWTGARFERGRRIRVDDQGRIASLDAGEDEVTDRMAGIALLPGFVNAHSHAFQRGLRGRGERFPAGAGSFWSWREAMYGLVAELDEDRVHELSLRAFTEMRAAGITAVGEFHYVHHGRSSGSLDGAVVAAAADAGLRLVLLQVYYRTGSIGKPLAPEQARFDAVDPTTFWKNSDRVAALLDGRTQSLGTVVHSVRAASPEDLVAIHGEARDRGHVFHMHLEEQRQEIADCVAAYGQTPLALVNERLEPDARFTAVHGTHSTREDLEPFLAGGANLCLCPLTEANLGDGLADLGPVLSHPDQLCLGTDSNARISMVEEMRWLELGQRLAHERRGVVRDADGEVARLALAAATTGGARSLGLEAGALRVGALADFALVDLEAPELAGWSQDTLAESLVFGAGDRAVVGSLVGGEE